MHDCFQETFQISTKSDWLEWAIQKLSLTPYSFRFQLIISDFQNSVIFVVNKNDKKQDDYPDWMDSANDRKTPYTETEIDILVEDFISSFDEEEWLAITSKCGAGKARERIRAGFVKMDMNNLINMTPNGLIN